MPMPKGAKRSGEFLWGPRRMSLGLSLSQLSQLARVNAGDLSRAERGLLSLRGPAFERVMVALETVRSAGPLTREAPAQ